MASNFFSSVFGQRAGSDEPPASVLAEWNKYAGDDQGTFCQHDYTILCVEHGRVLLESCEMLVRGVVSLFN